jgi:two-component system chemotaxis response regulator CheB
LPPDFPAIVGVVLHIGQQSSILPELLTGRGALPARHAADGEELRPGRIYVAPPDEHMLFTPGRVRLSRGPRENHARPAVDPLFRSVALGWGSRAIGVVLTGDLDDGTAGLAAIKECGGIAVVEDPATALEPSMPRSALANVAVDHCLPLPQIVPALERLVGQSRDLSLKQERGQAFHEQAVFEGKSPMENLEAIARPSTLTCPDCGGALWEMKQTRPLRYRCHTGHAFGAVTLDRMQAETAEHALWSSVRALRERQLLLRRLATVSQQVGDQTAAEAGLRQAEALTPQIDTLVELLEGQATA